MGQYSRRPSLQQQRCIAKQVQRIDANHFFNLHTSPQLLDQVEALLPEHRERTLPPTVTLATFLAQAMSRPKAFPRMNKPRRALREEIRRYGHLQKTTA